MTDDVVRLDARDDVSILRFDRPPVNAIDISVVRALAAALERVAELPAHRPLVVTGTGRCFSAGLDLKRVPRYDAAEQRQMLEIVNRTVAALYGSPRPVVAAMNGHALAAGLVLALACDYRVVTSDRCKLGLPEVTAGVPYPAAPMRIVRAEIPPHAARVLVLTGRALAPPDALALGVVDEVVAPDRVLGRAIEIARELGASPDYGRIKTQLRAEVIADLQHVVAENDDPMLAGWITHASTRT
jgi:enoyl-CoA hydratase